MTRRLTLTLAVLCASMLACRRSAQPVAQTADERVRALAGAYLDGYFERNPDQVTLYGVPGRHHDKLPDNSLDALAIWQTREDAWLKDAAAIDPAAIASPSLRATYAIAREALDGSIAARACRNELWTVSQMVNGWQIQFGYLVTIQPVGTDTRWNHEQTPAAVTARNRQFAPRSEAWLLRAQRQHPARHRPDAESDLDAGPRVAVRFAGRARQDTGVREGLRRAGRR